MDSVGMTHSERSVAEKRSLQRSHYEHDKCK